MDSNPCALTIPVLGIFWSQAYSSGTIEATERAWLTADGCFVCNHILSFIRSPEILAPDLIQCVYHCSSTFCVAVTEDLRLSTL